MSKRLLTRRLALLLGLVLAASAPASAQWTCLSGDCRAGTGRAQSTTSDGLSRTYVGSFQNGSPDGWGVLDFSNGEHYEGDFRSGDRDGTGIYTWPSGQRYDGGWRDDQRDGQGTLILASGTRYEGAFRNGDREDMHEVTYTDGRRERVRFRGDEAVRESAPRRNTPVSTGRTLTLGRNISGSLTDRSPQHDVPGLGDRAAQDYALRLSSGQSVTVRMEGDFDTYLRVMRGTETLAYNDDEGSTRVSEVAFTAPSAGTYTVRATTFRADGRGSFTIRATQGGGSDETVVQGTLTNGDASVPMTASDAVRKADPYLVNVRAGQTLVVEMTSSAFDTYLRIEHDGAKVAHNDDAGSTSRSFIEYTVPASGVYAIYAGSFSESGRGDYTLRYSVR